MTIVCGTDFSEPRAWLVRRGAIAKAARRTSRARARDRWVRDGRLGRTAARALPHDDLRGAGWPRAHPSPPKLTRLVRGGGRRPSTRSTTSSAGCSSTSRRIGIPLEVSLALAMDLGRPANLHI